MSGIIFFYTEVTVDQEKIIDFGAINDKGEELHTGRVDLFSAFDQYLTSHNKRLSIIYALLITFDKTVESVSGS